MKPGAATLTVPDLNEGRCFGFPLLAHRQTMLPLLGGLHFYMYSVCIAF